MKKRILSAILVLAVILSAFSALAVTTCAVTTQGETNPTEDGSILIVEQYIDETTFRNVGDDSICNDNNAPEVSTRTITKSKTLTVIEDCETTSAVNAYVEKLITVSVEA